MEYMSLGLKRKIEIVNIFSIKINKNDDDDDGGDVGDKDAFL